MADPNKDELNALIKKAGVGKRTAKKLHQANGTDGSPAPAAEAPPARRGHGSASAKQPDLGEF